MKIRKHGAPEEVPIESLAEGQCFYTRDGVLCMRLRSRTGWISGHWYTELKTGQPFFECSGVLVTPAPEAEVRA